MGSGKLLLRLYDPARDETALLQLWAEAFGASWPLEPAWLRAVALENSVYQPGDHLLAEMEGQMVGFALSQPGPGASPRSGGLLALGVRSDARRQGIGCALAEAAFTHLRKRGVDEIHLGSGGINYFWPGVPANLEGAWSFFRRLGYAETWRSVDMVRSLEDYATPASIWQRVHRQRLGFTLREENDVESVLAFVATEYPAWLPYYTLALEDGQSDEIILARSSGGSIVGACLVEFPTLRWAGCFDGPVGAPGCILTAESARGRGIGLALTARATEVLQERGCRTGLIGWTWLVDWYGKLGYQVWQEYIMSRSEHDDPS